MGNLHYGAGGGSSYPEVAERRAAEVAEHRIVVDIWLAAEPRRADILANWLRVPSGGRSLEATEEARYAWWRASPPWLRREQIRGLDFVRAVAARHGMWLYGADSRGAEAGVSAPQTDGEEPGEIRVIVTWRTDSMAALSSCTARGPANRLAAFAADLAESGILAQVFDE